MDKKTHGHNYVDTEVHASVVAEGFIFSPTFYIASPVFKLFMQAVTSWQWSDRMRNIVFQDPISSVYLVLFIGSDLRVHEENTSGLPMHLITHYV